MIPRTTTLHGQAPTRPPAGPTRDQLIRLAAAGTQDGDLLGESSVKLICAALLDALAKLDDAERNLRIARHAASGEHIAANLMQRAVLEEQARTAALQAELATLRARDKLADRIGIMVFDAVEVDLGLDRPTTGGFHEEGVRRRPFVMDRHTAKTRVIDAQCTEVGL